MVTLVTNPKRWSDGTSASTSTPNPATVVAALARSAPPVPVSVRESARERFADVPIRVLVMDDDHPADFAGRALMVDDETVLLAAATDGGSGEEAMWAEHSSIGRILARFMQAGVDSGVNRT